MAKRTSSFMQTLITIVRTLATFTLCPNSNYTQYVTTPEQMMRLSWNQTGQNLKAAIDKVGRDYRNEESPKIINEKVKHSARDIAKWFIEKNNVPARLYDAEDISPEAPEE